MRPLVTHFAFNLEEPSINELYTRGKYNVIPEEQGVAMSLPARACGLADSWCEILVIA